MGLFRSENEDDIPETRDVLVTLKTDGTAEIQNVAGINEERILAGPFVGGTQISVPINDVSQYVGPTGRIFVYPTVKENVTDCKRIAALEASTVLKQITHFEREYEPPGKPPNKLLIFGGIFIFLLLLIVMLR